MNVVAHHRVDFFPKKSETRDFANHNANGFEKKSEISD